MLKRDLVAIKTDVFASRRRTSKYAAVLRANRFRQATSCGKVAGVDAAERRDATCPSRAVDIEIITRRTIALVRAGPIRDNRAESFIHVELTAIIEAAGLSIPTMEMDPECWVGWRCQWHVDEEDRFEKADEIAAALVGTPLRNCKIYTTINLVEIYVD